MITAARMPTSDGPAPEDSGSVSLQHTPCGKSIVKMEAPLVEGVNLEAGYVAFAFGALKKVSYK